MMHAAMKAAHALVNDGDIKGTAFYVNTYSNAKQKVNSGGRDFTVDPARGALGDAFTIDDLARMQHSCLERTLAPSKKQSKIMKDVTESISKSLTLLWLFAAAARSDESLSLQF